MKKISIITPTFNEELNIKILCERIKHEFLKINYDYEHIVIDNCSTDNTVSILRDLCKKDTKLKVIVNNRNYGHLNSPFYAIKQVNSDAAILITSDFQDPLELIQKFINLWEKGHKIILAQKLNSDENFILRILRKAYYRILIKFSNTNLTKDTTGAGLYDKTIINILKNIKDPIPYLRGLITEIESDIKTIQFNQPKRKFGKSKNNLFTLIDLALLGFVKHSKLPLRLIIIFGFLMSFISILVSIIFLIYKIFYWSSFDVGIAPIVIGFFFISAIQMITLGIIGEYISVTLTHVRNLPLVIEKERINFDE